MESGLRGACVASPHLSGAIGDAGQKQLSLPTHVVLRGTSRGRSLSADFSGALVVGWDSAEAHGQALPTTSSWMGLADAVSCLGGGMGQGVVCYSPREAYPPIPAAALAPAS